MRNSWLAPGNVVLSSAVSHLPLTVTNFHQVASDRVFRKYGESEQPLGNAYPGINPKGLNLACLSHFHSVRPFCAFLRPHVLYG